MASYDDRFRLDKIQYLVRNSEIAVEALGHWITRHPKNQVAFYGCGKLAQAIINSDVRPDPEFTFFITSFDENPTDFYGFERLHARSVNERKPDAIILLSLAYEKMMLDALKDFNVTGTIYRLNDILQMALNDSGFNQKISGILSRNIIPQRQSLAAMIQRMSIYEKPVICFTAEYLTFAYLKRMKYLKKAGFSIIVLVENPRINGSIRIDEFDYRNYFDDYIVVKDYFISLTDLLNTSEFDLVHMVPSTSNLFVFAEQIIHKKCPVIVDYWDVKEILFDDTEENKDEALYFKILFCHSDGVIIKDAPQIMEALEEKYRHSPKWLHFPSYVSLPGIKNRAPRNQLKQTGRYRIVYAGNLQNNAGTHVYSVHSSILEAARELTGQGIAFDIYNATDENGSGFEDYLELSDRIDLFTYHFAVSPEELIDRLTDYDYGWFCFAFSRKTESDFFTATTFGSKLATYLEAGLPMLVSPEQKYCHDLVEKYGVGKGISFEQIGRLNEILNKVDYQKLSMNVEKFRQTWSMENHMDKIAQFYREIMTFDLNRFDTVEKEIPAG